MNKNRPVASFGAVILLFTALLLSLAACAPSSQKISTTSTGHASSASRPGSLAQITSTTKHNHQTPTSTKPTPTPHQTTTSPTVPAQPVATPPPSSPIPTTIPVPVPTSPPTSGGGSSATTQAAQAVFAQINQERASMGLPPFQWSNQLVQSAHNHNLAMQNANQLSHQLSGEPALGTRITNVGIHWSQAAENIGVGSGDLTSAATGLNTLMFNEQPPDDGHRLNILSTNTLIGIDVIVDTQHNKVWLTEDFAKPF